VKTAAAALAFALAALVLASAASSTTFGVADDAGKYGDDSGAGFFSMLNDLGMTENRVAVLWDPANPTTIVDQAFLDRSVPQATRRGIELMFAIYPLKGARARRHPERHRAVRAVRREGRSPLSAGAQDHLPQRGQPAALPPAAVRRRR
jgi:hypothetical protein